MPVINEGTPTDKILTDDGKLVGVGDAVWCYYDGFWAVIVSINDTHQTTSLELDARNQVLWADVATPDGWEPRRTGYYNGQRLASYRPAFRGNDAVPANPREDTPPWEV